MVSHKLFLFLALFMVVTSCRHQSENVNPAASWRVRSIKTQFDKTTYDYVNGQLSQINVENLLRDTLGHIPKNVCTNFAIENGELLRRSCSTNQNYGFSAQIGANGKISDHYEAYDFQSNSYDNDGFSIEIKHFSRGTTNRRLYQTYKYDIVNNNPVKEWAIDNNGKAYLINELFYFEDKLNTIGNENFGLTWLGRSSHNLLKKTTHYSNSDTTVINYLYDFDAQNRVIRKQYQVGNGNIWLEGEYTYW